MADSEISHKIYSCIDAPPDPFNEAEFRLGRFRAVDRKKQRFEFDPNVGLNTFGKIVKGFRQHYGEPKTVNMLTVNFDDDSNLRVRIIEEDPLQPRIRQFCINETVNTTGTGVYEIQEKRRIKVEDDATSSLYPIRIAYALETPKSPDRANHLLASDVMRTYRHAKRFSYRCDEFTVNGRDYKITLDCTVNHSGRGKSLREAGIMGAGGVKSETYEVELDISRNGSENIVPDDLNDERMSSIVKRELARIVLFFQGGISAATTDTLIRQLNMYLELCERHFRLPKLASGPVADLSLVTLRNMRAYFVGPNIGVLTRDEIKQGTLLPDEITTSPPYCVTDKADGTRSLLYIDEEGKGVLLMTDTAYVKDDKDESKQQKLQGILRVIPTGITSVAKRNSLFDGEFLIIDGQPYYLLFDAIVVNDKAIYDQPFWKQNLVNLEGGKIRWDQSKDCRKYYLDNIYNAEIVGFKRDVEKGVLCVKPKNFYHYVVDEADVRREGFRNLQSLVKDDGGPLIYQGPLLQYHLDGFIFQECADVYPIPSLSRGQIVVADWPKTKKWKPVYQLTVDFRLLAKTTVVKEGVSINLPDGKYAEYEAAYDEKPDRSYMTSTYKCYAPIVNGVPRTEQMDAINPGNIVECRYLTSGRGGYWQPVKVRLDKSYPNSLRVYNSNMSLISSPITRDMLEVRGGRAGGSDLLYGANRYNRKISNAIITIACRAAAKEGPSTRSGKLIRERGLAVLDLACGSGQIMEAMVHSNVRFYVGVDIRRDVQEAAIPMINYIAQKREKNPNLEAHFYSESFMKHLDRSDNAKLATEMIESERFNVVVCNFAIHYAMINPEGFIHNVVRNLADGGIFVGVYLDWEKVVPYLKNLRIHVSATEENGYVTVQTVKTMDGRMRLEAIKQGAENSRYTIWSLADNGDNSYDAYVAGLYESAASKEYKMPKDFMSVIGGKIMGNAMPVRVNGAPSFRLVDGRMKDGTTGVMDIDINSLPDVYPAYPAILGKIKTTNMDRLWLGLHSAFMFTKDSKAIVQAAAPVAPAPVKPAVQGLAPPIKKVKLSTTTVAAKPKASSLFAKKVPLSEEPVAIAPATREPVAIAPATREPVAIAPATREPVAIAPATREPVAIAPATGEPVAIAPATREPVAIAPATREPVAIAPATGERKPRLIIKAKPRPPPPAE